MEPTHRTLGRETIQVRAVLPPPPPPDPANPLPGTDTECDRIAEALRRAIRLGGLAYATEEPNGVRWTGTASPQGGRGGGHQTTMIYLHVMKRPGAGGPSPLDIP